MHVSSAGQQSTNFQPYAAAVGSTALSLERLDSRGTALLLYVPNGHAPRRWVSLGVRLTISAAVSTYILSNRNGGIQDEVTHTHLNTLTIRNTL
jgi:hypothetical protein